MRATMRWVTAVAVVLGLAPAVPALALTQAEEAAYAVLATGANLFYVPAKFVVAAASIPVGGLAGAFSGGNLRTAYAIWVPAMGGTYFLTNSHLDGSVPVEFFGFDYEDQPAPDTNDEQSTIFDAPYRELYR